MLRRPPTRLTLGTTDILEYEQIQQERRQQQEQQRQEGQTAAAAATAEPVLGASERAAAVRERIGLKPTPTI
eukprot:m.102961 g.102961  ORF g.102961 m.102961 type:complete len:72 (-) comp15550_c1_seq2:1088-1303(-)